MEQNEAVLQKEGVLRVHTLWCALLRAHRGLRPQRLRSVVQAAGASVVLRGRCCELLLAQR
jgi:hypothetical protein